MKFRFITLEVYFIDIGETGSVIHGFGCSHSKAADREFLGLFTAPDEAVNQSLSRVRKVTVCKNCCTEFYTPGLISLQER